MVKLAVTCSKCAALCIDFGHATPLCRCGSFESFYWCISIDAPMDPFTHATGHSLQHVVADLTLMKSDDAAKLVMEMCNEHVKHWLHSTAVFAPGKNP